MNWLSDNLLEHLRIVADAPDLSATKYRLLEKFARGGMGTIYLAEDTQLQRKVALKVLHTPDLSGDLSVRMLREARVIARLEHPGIVPVHDVGELPDGRVFYVMKFVQGQRLDQYVHEQHAIPERLRIFQKACDAVAFAHSHGVLHRDLKPENIMVGAFGEVLVMDWGLAKVMAGNSKIEDRSSWIVDRGSKSQQPVSSNQQAATNEQRPAFHNEYPDEHPTQHGAVLGTPAYMSPEQRRGANDQIDQRADIYALGAILGFLLGPRAAKPRVPKQLAAICAKAMAEIKTQRYDKVQTLAADVERFLNGLSVSSYKENVLEIAWRWIKQYRFILLLVLAYLAMRILFVFLLRP